MKKIILIAMVALMAASCTEQQRTRKFGDTSVINVGPNKRVINVGPNKRVINVDPNKRVINVDPNKRVINVDPNKRVMMATWKNNNLFYMVEDMPTDYQPHDKALIKSSSFGVLESKIVFHETRR